MSYDVAMVGCGAIAWGHALGWSKCPQTNLVAVADPLPASRNSLGDAFGVTPEGRYDDFQSMLEHSRFDIVSVCVWTRQHLDAVLAAIANGAKLILCEKPMAANLGEAEAMTLASARAGVLLAIGHQRRFFPGWNRARSLIESGMIGEPTHVWSRVVGGLLNNGTHAVDLIRFILGDPRAETVIGSVQRTTDRYERAVRMEDSALAMVQFEGGVRAFIESDLGPAAPITANATVHGTDGTVEIVENRVRVMSGDSAGWQEVSDYGPGRQDAWPDPSEPGLRAIHGMVGYLGRPEHVESFALTFVDQARCLVDWLEGRIDQYPGEAGSGYAALEIILAIYESVRLREVTRLPLQTRLHPLDLMVADGTLPVRRPGRYDVRSPIMTSDQGS
jgi:predicted dehydrogenase